MVFINTVTFYNHVYRYVNPLLRSASDAVFHGLHANTKT